MRTRLVHLEDSEVDDARNLSFKERTVGVYEEITKSEMHDLGWDAEPYIPAAWSGRNASGPVGHHHKRLRAEELGGE